MAETFDNKKYVGAAQLKEIMGRISNDIVLSHGNHIGMSPTLPPIENTSHIAWLKTYQNDLNKVELYAKSADEQGSPNWILVSGGGGESAGAFDGGYIKEHTPSNEEEGETRYFIHLTKISDESITDEFSGEEEKWPTKTEFTLTKAPTTITKDTNKRPKFHLCTDTSEVELQSTEYELLGENIKITKAPQPSEEPKTFKAVYYTCAEPTEGAIGGTDVTWFTPFEIKGAGGGGGEKAVIIVETTPPTTKEILYGNDVDVSFTWSDTMYSTVKGYLSWNVNGTVYKSEYDSISQGSVTSTIKKEWLKEGENKINIVLRDAAGTRYTNQTEQSDFIVKAYTMSLTWDLDDLGYYGTSEKSFNVTQTTNVGDRKIIISVDGETYAESTATTRTVNFVIKPGELENPHGAHHIEARMETTIAGETASTMPISAVGVWIDGTTTSKIASMYPDGQQSVKQYTVATVKWLLIDPQNETTTAYLFINNHHYQTLENVPRQVQTWGFADTSEIGTYPLMVQDTMTAPSTSASSIVQVEESDIKLNIIRNGLAIDLNPEGHTEHTFGYDEYDSRGTFVRSHALEYSSNFDWVNGGFQKDSDGATALVIKKGTSITFYDRTENRPRSLFELRDKAESNGKTIQFIFKTTNMQKYDCEFGQSMENDKGIKFGGHKAIFNFSKSTSSQYAEDKKTELGFVAKYWNPTLSRDDNSTIKFWDQGVPSSQNLITKGDSLSHSDPSIGKFTIGSDSCDIWIYRFKMYVRGLEDYEMLDCFTADATTYAEKTARYYRNNIFKDDKITVDKVKLMTAAPNLHVITIEASEFPPTKGGDGKKDCTIYHQMGNGKAENQWHTEKGDKMAKWTLQGTSSMQYIAAAGNLDLDMNKCKMIQGTTIGQGEEMTSGYAFGDETKYIPVKYFNLKANVASSENANNRCLVYLTNENDGLITAQRVADPRVRNTLYGEPCAVFVKNTGTERLCLDNIIDKSKSYARWVEPGEEILYFAGDMLNSKKNTKVCGQTDWEHGQVCIEFAENQNLKCTFRETDDMTNEFFEVDPDEFLPDINEKYRTLYPGWTDLEISYYRPKTETFEEIGTEAKPWANGVTLQKLPRSVSTTTVVVTEHTTHEEQSSITWTFDPTNPQKILFSNYPQSGSYDVVVTYQYDAHESQFAIRYPEDEFSIGLCLYRGASQSGRAEEIYEMLDAGDKKMYDFFKNTMINFVEMHNYVASTCAKPYNNDPTSDDYCPTGFDEQPLVSPETRNGVTYTNDTLQLRQARWLYRNTETGGNNKIIDDYFDMGQLQFHYLFTSFFLMVDNRAKNTFISYEQMPNGTWKWNFSKNYDNDTAMGIDNKGNLVLRYGLEDRPLPIGSVGQTEIEGIPSYRKTFNAYNNVLWCNVRDYSDLRTKYNEAEIAGVFDADKVIKLFEDYQRIRPEGLMIADAYGKYDSPLVSGPGSGSVSFVGMQHGEKINQRYQFLKFQQLYMSSKYVSSSIRSTDWTITATNPASGVNQYRREVQVAPYSDMYITSSKDDQQDSNTIYIQQDKEPYTIEVPQMGTGSEVNMLIYGGPNLRVFDTFAFFFAKKLDLKGNTKLKKFELGSTIDGFKSTLIPDAAMNIVAQNPVAEVINLQGVQKTDGTKYGDINCKPLSALKEFRAYNSSITGVKFANGCPLEVCHLPTETSLIHAFNIKTDTLDFQCQDYSNIRKLYIDDCTSFPIARILKNATTNYKNEMQLRLTNITNLNNATFENVSAFAGILNGTNYWRGYDITGSEITDRAVMSGTIKFNTIGSTEVNQILAYFNGVTDYMTHSYASYSDLVAIAEKRYTVGELTIVWDTLVEGRSIFKVQFLDYASVPYENLTQWVVKGQTATDPSTTFTPLKPQSAQYIFRFSGWDKQFRPITADTDYQSQFSQTIRSYTVVFHGEDSTTEFDRQTKSYGETISYSTVGENRFPEKANHLCLGFRKQGAVTDTPALTFTLNEAFVGVGGPSDIIHTFAIFEEIKLPSVQTEFGQCTWAQILAISQKGYQGGSNTWAETETVSLSGSTCQTYFCISSINQITCGDSIIDPAKYTFADYTITFDSTIVPTITEAVTVKYMARANSEATEENIWYIDDETHTPQKWFELNTREQLRPSQIKDIITKPVPQYDTEQGSLTNWVRKPLTFSVSLLGFNKDRNNENGSKILNFTIGTFDVLPYRLEYWANGEGLAEGYAHSQQRIFLTGNGKVQGQVFSKVQWSNNAAATEVWTDEEAFVYQVPMDLQYILQTVYKKTADGSDSFIGTEDKLFLLSQREVGSNWDSTHQQVLDTRYPVFGDYTQINNKTRKKSEVGSSSLITPTYICRNLINSSYAGGVTGSGEVELNGIATSYAVSGTKRGFPFAFCIGSKDKNFE